MSPERDLAALYEQLSMAASRARVMANEAEDVADQVVAKDYGHQAASEAFAAWAFLDDAAQRAEKAASAVLAAADMAAQFEIPDLSPKYDDARDPELEKERHRVASHEGGHAVGCARHGFPIINGEIDVSRTFFGLGKIDESGFIQFDAPDLLTEKQARDIAAICYSGAEATVLWHLLDGDAPPTARRLGYEGSSHDMALAAQVLGGDRKLLRAAQRQATAEVAKWWPSIQSVAEAFMERERLSGRAIERAA